MFLVIGYGNLLRGDDGAGRLVAESLGKLPPRVIVESVHQLHPELAERVSRASGVVFVDCAAEGVPGDVVSSSVPPPQRGPCAVTHPLTPGGLLEYARRLYGHRPAAAQVSLVGHAFGFGQPLSDAVRAAIDPAREEVLRRISLWRLRGRLPSGGETLAFESAGTRDP